MKLKVDWIQKKTTKTGKPYYSIKSDGQWYSSWPGPGIEHWAQGQEVEIQGIETSKEGFKNIILIKSKAVTLEDILAKLIEIEAIILEAKSKREL